MLSLPTPPNLAEWVSRLVQIPSVTPEQAGPRAGEPGEAAMAEAVAGWFAQFGGEVHWHEVQPGRSSVYAIWRGRTERWLAVDVHTDTVGVEQMTDPPFDGRIADGRVYGRGAVDTKASLGVVLALLENMHAAGVQLEENLLIAATVDEETGATGAPGFAEWLRARELVLDELVVAEPTGCTPVHGHKGLVRMEFTAHGQTAHSAQPVRGKNAIWAAARVALAMETEQNRLQSLPATALGIPQLTVVLINGGIGRNVVPDTCSVAIDRRLTDSEDPLAVTAQLIALAEAASPLPLTTEIWRQITPFYQPADSGLVTRMAAWSGQTPTVAPYGTNAWAYGDVTRQRIVLGPGSIDQAHGPVEWVEIDELAKLADIYARWWGLG
jgi:acetylornithine deacetylase/succinyl-diaminopimelate desuccinylase-like protein